MEDYYNQQPREKSFWSSVGDFFLNALIIVGSIVSVVGIATIFSNTVSNQIDDWTKDKDGKGGWGSWLRQKAGVSTEQETSATDKLSQMKDKVVNKGKEVYNKLFGSDKPAENQETTPPANNSPSNNPPANDSPAADKQKEGFGISDAAATALLLYGGKFAYKRLNPRVHVDKDGNIHSVTVDQVKAENAVAQATKDIEEARRIQKEAQLKADSLKGPKIIEDEANNKKRWYQRGNKTANTEYNNAMKALEKANSSVTNLTTVIEEGNKVISTGQPSNNSRLRAYMGKLFRGGAGPAVAGETEFGIIEHATTKPAAGATAAAPATPATNIVKVPGMGNISATPQTSSVAVAPTAEPTTVQKPAINVETSTETGKIVPTDTSAPKTQAQQGTSDEAIKTKAVSEKPLQAGEPPTVKGRVGKAAGSLGIIAGTIATIRGDFENAKEHWNHKDEQGQPDRRGTALLQGVGTTIEVGSFIAAPFSGPFAPIVIAGGTASKEAISMGHEYVTGKPGGVTQSLISSVVEATGTEVHALAKDVYNSTGFGEEAKEKAKAELKRQHDKAVEEAMLKLSPEHKAAVDAWLIKARETGRNDIDPLILIEQVKDSNLRLPVNTPSPNSLARNDSQIGNK